jgi:phosphate transport system ATP-binding protein
MNDLIPGARVAGRVTFHGTDLYAAGVDPIQVRRRIGMVFQKPNPFPKSIYDNVAYGLRINGIKGNMDDMVEQALRGAALWDEVKDKLKTSGLALSGGGVRCRSHSHRWLHRNLQRLDIRSTTARE